MTHDKDAELAGYRHVVAHCWDLARDFVASRKAADPSIAVDLDFLVGRMLREITTLHSRAQFPADRNESRATWVLHLLANGEISVGKARDWLRNYICEGKEDPLPDVKALP